jgi:hypothetical protein
MEQPTRERSLSGSSSGSSYGTISRSSSVDSSIPTNIEDFKMKFIDLYNKPNNPYKEQELGELVDNAKTSGIDLTQIDELQDDMQEWIRYYLRNHSGPGTPMSDFSDSEGGKRKSKKRKSKKRRSRKSRKSRKSKKRRSRK